MISSLHSTYESKCFCLCLESEKEIRMKVKGSPLTCRFVGGLSGDHDPRFPRNPGDKQDGGTLMVNFSPRASRKRLLTHISSSVH